MEVQTRELLKLLISDATAAILDALRAGDQQADDIATTTGVPGRTVSYTLNKLAAQGIVRSTTMRTSKPGAPPKLWSLMREADLAAFDTAADHLTQRLIELRGEEHKKAVTTKAKRALRLVPPANAGSEPG
jgi:predicted ArsR family transcriptional regulator